jgi:hypothetical protein
MTAAWLKKDRPANGPGDLRFVNIQATYSMAKYVVMAENRFGELQRDLGTTPLSALAVAKLLQFVALGYRCSFLPGCDNDSQIDLTKNNELA